MNEQPGWHKHKLPTAVETELDHRHVRAANTVQRGTPSGQRGPRGNLAHIFQRSSLKFGQRHLTWHQLESLSS